MTWRGSGTRPCSWPSCWCGVSPCRPSLASGSSTWDSGWSSTSAWTCSARCSVCPTTITTGPRSGKTLTNLSNDVEALREFIAEGIVSIAGDLLKVAFILVAMIFINPRLALITFITIPLFVGATLAFRAGIRAGFREVRTANGEINVALSETISGIREIHQFTWEKESREGFDRSNTRYLKAYLGIVNAYALFFPAIEVVVNATMVLILLFSHFAIGVDAPRRGDLRLLRLREHVLLAAASARGEVQPLPGCGGCHGADLRASRREGDDRLSDGGAPADCGPVPEGRAGAQRTPAALRR